MTTEDRKLWELYKKTNRKELLEKIIDKYLSIVYYYANKLFIYASSTIDKDDLYSAGIIGLLEAIERFDISKGLEFSTYSSLRIKGAIIDELRKVDWVPRSIRQKTKSIDSAINSYFTMNGEMPSDKQIADELDMSLSDYYNITDNLGPLFLTSLDKNISSTSEGEPLKMSDLVKDVKIEPVEDELAKKKLREVLTSGISKLSDREKLVISLYYYEDLSLKEIGNILEVSESRVSQIHSSSILKLKNLIDNADIFESYTYI
ncbi:MAG: FliA/WhiG family RNA polymerase sigma factor [Candidatus Cloacimonadota bacterium]|nr:FliA/WhiG family RNA polymerase sigma factor [Candidatus Cloacimonadota bacterium]